MTARASHVASALHGVADIVDPDSDTTAPAAVASEVAEVAAEKVAEVARSRRAWRLLAIGFVVMVALGSAAWFVRRRRSEHVAA